MKQTNVKTTTTTTITKTIRRLAILLMEWNFDLYIYVKCRVKLSGVLVLSRFKTM